MKLPNAELDDPIIKHVRHDVTTLNAGQTVGEALAQLRTQQLGEKIVYFYALDDEGRLVGVVPTRRLLASGPEQRVADIMLARVLAIPYLATVLDACEFFIQYRFLAFPVIDEERKLVGVVDVSLFADELIEVTERHSYENVFQLLGVQIDNLRTASPWAEFRGRFPWLLCNIAGGLACAAIASRYEAFLDQVIVLALFIPVVLALSESVSMQSMTITLQGLHTPLVNWRAVFRRLSRELVIAAGLGVACGSVVGGAAWAWKGQPPVAVAIGTSITLAVTTAAVLGVALPTVVHALKVDPKIAAGPIVLAAADLTTLVFYFNLSMVMLV